MQKLQEERFSYIRRQHPSELGFTAHTYVIDDDALATKHEPKLPSVPRRERFLPSHYACQPARHLWSAQR